MNRNLSKGVLFVSFVFAIILFQSFEVLAVELNNNVCCEKTVTGAFCQNVPSTECATDARQVPTSCDSTSYCKLGTCYDSSEGTCLDNTPQLVCNSNGGIWSEETPVQCSLGCCILGDQAAFTSLVRCKKLSGFLGLQTNYDKGITNEIACIESVQKQDRGACVFEFEFEKTCRFTTRGECDAQISSTNGTSAKGVFYKNKLCSAEELGTNCGPSDKTTCLPGKDGVYFVDTCNNPANIYDTSKLKDKEYWTNVKPIDFSCGVGSANIESTSCGNCNYLGGSYCRDSNIAGKRASYGSNICADLNCVDENDKERKHGESWCLAKEGKIDNAVGERYFKKICQNGEVTTEACEDYRAEECVQDSIDTALGPFSQAACRVNRWQECIAQTDQQDCENSDRRDCRWQAGITFPDKETTGGVCLPRISPGLKFWNSEESQVVCGIGNRVCVVKYEKGIFSGEPECVENCDCLTPGWEAKYGAMCSALGDCGTKTNYVDKVGFKTELNVVLS